MKTISIPVYTFDELNPAAQDKARDWFRESSAGDEFYAECTLDECADQGALLGFDFKERNGSPCIYYTGFSSQGDGACFEGTWRASDVKADQVADGWGDGPATAELKRIAAVFADLAKHYPDASFSVSHSGRYYHENSAEFNFDSFPNADSYGADWPEEKRGDYLDASAELTNASRDFMRWIYRQLESSYEDENSDETVGENIRCNDYLFTAEGSRSAVL